MTIEEYFAWELQQELRYEYVNGEVFAMTGGTIPHNDIALNFYRALYPHLRARGCRVNVSDVKVQVTPQSPYYYPDVIVSCDPQDLNARKFIQNPKIIVEVLSPVQARKIGAKIHQLPENSLFTRIFIDRFGKNFRRTLLSGRGQNVALLSLH